MTLMRELSKKVDCVALHLSHRVFRTSVSVLICVLMLMKLISLLSTILLCVFFIWWSHCTMQNLRLTQCNSFSDQIENSLDLSYVIFLIVNTQVIIWVRNCSKDVSVKNHFHISVLKFLNKWTVSELTVILKWVSSVITLSHIIFQYLIISFDNLLVLKIVFDDWYVSFMTLWT